MSNKLAKFDYFLLALIGLVLYSLTIGWLRGGFSGEPRLLYSQAFVYLKSRNFFRSGCPLFMLS